MVRIYLDFETYRPSIEGAFIDEKIISAGLLIDETPYHESSLIKSAKLTLMSEWNGFNECQIVAKVQDQIKTALRNYRFTVICGFGILRFDIPLFVSRCFKYSLDKLDEATKMWHDCFSIDYAQQLLAANGNMFKGATLDNIIAVAGRLGLKPPEHSMDGSSMRELYPEKKYDDIEKHLKEDLIAIRWLDLYGAKKLIERSVKEGRPIFRT